MNFKQKQNPFICISGVTWIVHLVKKGALYAQNSSIWLSPFPCFQSVKSCLFRGLNTCRSPNTRHNKMQTRSSYFHHKSIEIQMVELRTLKTAVAMMPGPFCADHWAIALNMNLNLRYDRLKGVRTLIAISTAQRSWRGKTLLEKQKMIFRDALNDNNMYQKVSRDKVSLWFYD